VYSSELVIEDDVVLGTNSSSLRIESQGDRAGVLGRVTEIDMASGLGLPLGKLVTISNALVEDVDGATPDMEVMELVVGPALSGEQIIGRETIVLAGNMIVHKDGIVDGHRPQLRVSDFGPVDGSMEKESPGNGHHILDTFLCDAVVVVGSSSSETDSLLEVAEMSCEVSLLVKHAS